jgi:hypothetical protein
MCDSGEAIGFNTLHARLSPADQERLAAIVLEASGELSPEDGAACIAAMKREAAETLKKDLKARVKAAEREGRIQDAIGLMRQLSELA